MSEFLTREELLSLTKRRYRTVPIPEAIPDVGGKKFRLQSLTDEEQSAYEAEIIARKGGLRKNRLADAKRRLIALCLVDGQGKRIFGDDDISALKKIDGRVIELLHKEANAHVGYDDEAIEDLVKNSETTTVDDSCSDSPSRSGSPTSTPSAGR